MSNRYFLTIAAIGRFPERKIDQDRFIKLKSSKAALTHALAIEEKYEILISNYLDLEREAINASVSEMVRNHVEYSDFFDIRLALDIRLVNLLTAVRLYFDQLSSHICACVPNDENAKNTIRNFRSSEYDDHFEYRFMEALRNYVQHSGIPVHRISIGPNGNDLNDRLLEYSLCFVTQKKELLLDNCFKRKVLNEMPEEVNLWYATRIYIESISRIHNKARKLVEETVESSRQVLEEAINDYRQIYEKEFVGLYAYEYEDEQKHSEVSVLLEWDDVRKNLIKRNSELINLRKRYVTSQAHNKSPLA